MELQLGQKYQVRVIKIMPRFVIVELEDKSTQIIHVSKIANCFVKEISDFVSVDTMYEAEAVEGTTHPIELSLKHLDLKSTIPAVKKEFKQHRHTNQNHSANLDDMIAKSNSDLNDKFVQMQNRENRKNRRGRK